MDNSLLQPFMTRVKFGNLSCKDMDSVECIDFLFWKGILINTDFPGRWRVATLREESSQTNVILQYKLLASILSGVCSVI